ncbi:EF-hand domain-containing protein [Desulfovibrio porci]|uniref:EF-hand domain-containing protein n=1 Tax=Desulfovibrio porci TaxID=2605782 RepID=UPI002A80340E|nr:EF-hand domain-containing protein [Desulfovibrio porci]MDY3810659.1 EF-hand domain-containing protein [Desulfovibrio porci]
MTRVLRFSAQPVFWQMFALLALAGLLALPTLTRAADDPAKAAPRDKFEEMDTNKDGKVVLEEFQAAFPNMKESAFVVIDKNGDGAIERVEWDEFLKGHAAGMKPGMGGMPPKMGAPMNNMPGDPIIPPPGSADMPLVTPPNGR